MQTARLTNVVRVLEEAAKKIDLEINPEETNIIELIESVEDPYEMKDLIYEKVNDFKYLELKAQRMTGERK